MLVVKNSLAARAMPGTRLAAMFDGVAGTGGRLLGQRGHRQPCQGNHAAHRRRQLHRFEARGGVMDGEQLTADEVVAVSKWPSRTEQLSMLCGPDPSPGASWRASLTSVGGALASQIEERGKARKRRTRAGASGRREPRARRPKRGAWPKRGLRRRTQPLRRHVQC